jgi:hypothetical protein
MRTLVPAALLAGMLAVSGNAEAAQAAGQATAVAAVAKIYQDFAAEAVIDSPDLSVLDLFSRSKTAMARYVDDSLIALVMADRACAERTQGVCNLDFAPIWDSQDMVGTTVKIDEGKDPTRVAVELQMNDKVVRHLTYVMVKTAAGWRVKDIQYDTHESLVAMLKKKPS